MCGCGGIKDAERQDWILINENELIENEFVY
jgi:hypothetical protein